MPASLYRLAGKPHHTEVPADTFKLSPAEEVNVVHESSSPAADQIEVASTAETVEVIDPAPAPGTEQTETTQDVEVGSATNTIEEATVYPTWDPGWTKAKLLEVAASLNLSVTVENTKAQIIAALTEATST